jgi:hypothetical protein
MLWCRFRQEMREAKRRSMPTFRLRLAGLLLQLAIFSPPDTLARLQDHYIRQEGDPPVSVVFLKA